MANRTRPIIMRLTVTEYEKGLIEKKMQQLGTRNFGAYARKMLIDGYIIKVDYTQQKKLAAAVGRAASNINQICRRINSAGHFYADDIVAAATHGISNARIKATNNKIKLIIRRAYGFRNMDNMIAMIMLSCSSVHPSLPGR